MKTLSKPLFASGMLALTPLGASAGVITSSTTTPTLGDFASDASSTLDEGRQFQINSGRNFVGQAFTLGTTGDSNFLFESITFQVRDQGGTTEGALGLTLSIFTGQSTAAEDLLTAVTFSDTTIDASNNQFLTFGLTSAETDALGPLLAGQAYTAVLSTSIPEADGGSSFRIIRSSSDSYTGGDSFFGGDQFDTLDTVFFVNATVTDIAVPEPASLALLGLGGLALLGRRKKA